mgnify:CR=1 FL=1
MVFKFLSIFHTFVLLFMTDVCLIGIKRGPP